MKRFFLVLICTFIYNFTYAQSQEFRGVWITNVDSRVLETDEKIVEAMDYLASIGINVIFPVVYNKGYTLYPSEVFESHFGVKTLQQAAFMDRDFLERVIIEAHRNGIEVIPWFEFGFSTSYSQNGGHIIEKYPHWALRDNSGNLVVKNGFDWMSAIHPEVQEYMNSLILEVIDKYDVDGIQGDDRLPAMPVEGGYEDYTKELYKVEHNGLEPPASYTNSSWKKWRADKLTDYLQTLRDSIKSRGEDLILSSSPTPYYWGYNSYLQDSKTWAKEGLVDNIIPQLYQYTIGDYRYALNAINDVRNENPDIFVSGILAKAGSYVVSQDFLKDMMDENRNKSVPGECFFFYEALRANNDQLGEFIKENYYSEATALPHRNGSIYRPKADIVNETDVSTVVIGSWEEYPMKGYEGKIFRTDDQTEYASVEYFLNAPENSFYDVFIYMSPNTPWSDSAHYQIYSDSLIFNGKDSTSIYYDQSNTSLKGWQKIGTAYLSAGNKKVLKVDNKNLKDGQYVFTDAVMLMINRKKEVEIITSIAHGIDSELPSGFKLRQNYPNPFNPSTIIEYTIPSELNMNNNVNLSVFDVLGNKIIELVNVAQPAGSYKVNFNTSALNQKISSGVYFYKLQVGLKSVSKKMLLLK